MCVIFIRDLGELKTCVIFIRTSSNVFVIVVILSSVLLHTVLDVSNVVDYVNGFVNTTIESQSPQRELDCRRAV